MSVFSIGSFIALNKSKGGKRTPKTMFGWKPMSFLCNWETLTRHNVENTSEKIASVLFDKIEILNSSVIYTAYLCG